MNRTDGRTLAWALADSANKSMNPADHTTVCVKIGAGEHDSAIRYVLSFYAHTGAKLPCALAAPIQRWIDGYAGSDSEQILRRIYDRISVSAEDAASGDAMEVEPDCAPKRLVAQRVSARSAAVSIGIRHIPPVGLPYSQRRRVPIAHGEEIDFDLTNAGKTPVTDCPEPPIFTTPTPSP
jgi:hypothetical protein